MRIRFSENWVGSNRAGRVIGCFPSFTQGLILLEYNFSLTSNPLSPHRQVGLNPDFESSLDALQGLLSVPFPLFS